VTVLTTLFKLWSKENRNEVASTQALSHTKYKIDLMHCLLRTIASLFLMIGCALSRHATLSSKETAGKTEKAVTMSTPT
jgi:hypothetical protein